MIQQLCLITFSVSISPQSHHTQLHLTTHNNCSSTHSIPPHWTTPPYHTQQLHLTTLNNSISPHNCSSTHSTTPSHHTQQLHLTTHDNCSSTHSTTPSHHTQLHLTTHDNCSSTHSTTPSHHSTPSHHTWQLQLNTLNNSISPHSTTPSHHTQQFHLTTLNKDKVYLPSIGTTLWVPQPTRAIFNPQQEQLYIQQGQLSTSMDNVSLHSTQTTFHTQQEWKNNNCTLNTTFHTQQEQWLYTQHNSPHPTRTKTVHSTQLSTPNKNNNCTLNTTLHTQQEQQLYTQHNSPHPTRTKTVHSTQLSTPNKNEDCTLNTTLHTQQEQWFCTFNTTFHTTTNNELSPSIIHGEPPTQLTAFNKETKHPSKPQYQACYYHKMSKTSVTNY